MYFDTTNQYDLMPCGSTQLNQTEVQTFWFHLLILQKISIVAEDIFKIYN